MYALVNADSCKKSFLQDGFFMGELLDGRKGLVPSNFLEKLYGDDLFEFHRMVVFPEDDTDNEFLTVVPNHISYDHEDSASDHGGVPDMCKQFIFFWRL